MRRGRLTCAVTAALVATVLPGLGVTSAHASGSVASSSAASGSAASSSAAGSVEVPVPEGLVASDPSLTSDGLWVAFAGEVDGESGLYRHNTDTGTTEKVPTVVGELLVGTVAETSISGDGRFIAWALRAPGSGDGWDPTSQVYVTDARLGVTRLISSNSLDWVAGNEGSAEPVISDDGRLVAFTTRATDIVDKPTHGAGAAAGSDIVLADVADRGESVIRLVSPEVPGIDFTAPSLSGDGTRLAFVRGGGRVVLADRPGTDSPVLTDVAAGSSPALSADGSSVALARTQSQPGGVERRATWLRTLAGGAEVQADVEDKGWALRGDSAAPVADRDGGSVLLALTGAGTTDLVLRDVDLGTTRMVARAVDAAAGHDLSADGERIVHVAGGQLWLTDLGQLPDPRVLAPNPMWNPLVQRAATPARGKGYVLRVEPAAWEPLRATRIERQWLRNGRPIPGATGLTYEITAADLGRELKVRERLVVPGTPVGVATSRGYKVRPDHARLQAPSTLRWPGGKVTLRVRVRTLPGSETYVTGAATPQGTVLVRVGRRVVRTKVGADGWAKVVLPRQRPGRHRVQVRHLGTPYVTSAAPKNVSLVVRRGR